MQHAASFIPVPPGSDFPLANLPLGVCRRPGEDHGSVATRVGDHVVMLKDLEHAGLFGDTALGQTHYFCKRSLNKFMSAGPAIWNAARTRLTDLLRDDRSTLRDDAALRTRSILPLSAVEVLLPAEIGDYTDFYSSRQHAFNVGTMFRGPENALMPNYLWLPVGYHGRASSIVPSGTDVRRPRGQTQKEGSPPTFGASRMVDFELEMGFLIGEGNSLGDPISIADASRHVFGFVLLNDWSARDVQRWEYQPLGPFVSKNFATSISPWVVTTTALEPFRCPAPPQDPPPLPYLGEPDRFTYDIQLEVSICTQRQTDPFALCRSNFRHLYWTPAQQIAHHTVTGCNLRPGDLLASGTISGPTPDSYGSLLELAWRGERPIRLPSGEERASLQDGDTLILRGWCERGDLRIGFGECRGTVRPA